MFTHNGKAVSVVCCDDVVVNTWVGLGTKKQANKKTKTNSGSVVASAKHVLA